MASLDRIEVRIPADKQLARVARTAVSILAREAGIPAGRAGLFAALVARRFSGLASGGGDRPGSVELTVEPAAGGLDVRIRRGARPGAVLKVRKARKARKAPKVRKARARTAGPQSAPSRRR